MAIIKILRDSSTRRGALQASLVLALFFHLLATATIYTVGRLEILPAMFDSRGVGYFNDDNFSYMQQAEDLVNLLQQDGWRAWWGAPHTLHIKLYSLFFALFAPLFGFTILSVELLNLLYYLLILSLVYAIGREVYNRRVGLLASGLVGIWPSLVIHTTQVLRTPLYVTALLAFILAFVRLIALRRFSLVAVTVNLLLGGAALYVLRLLSQARWGLILAIALTGAVFIVVRFVLLGRARPWLIVVVMLVAVLGFLPRVGVIFSAVTGVPQPPLAENAPLGIALPSGPELLDYLDASAAQVGQIRQNFIDFYPGAGSNVDMDYKIRDFDDLLRYLPRATAVGLFEPTPEMWFVKGRTGLSTKVLSGFETLVMYLLEFFALFSWVRTRSRLAAIFLLLAVLMGVTGLGVVVLNIGTLFRLRYAYWILLLILGVGGAHEVFFPALHLTLSNMTWDVARIFERERAEDAPVLIVSNWDWVLYNFRLPLARALQEAGLEVVLVCPRGKYTERLEGMGFRWEGWNLDRRSTNPLREMVAILDLHRVYRRLKPAAVHHFTIKPILYGSLAARAARVPVVINNFTGLGYLFSDARKARILRWLVLPLLRRALSGEGFHTAFQNEADREHLVRLGVVDEGATTLIPGTGVNLKRYQPGEGGEAREKPVVLMAARLLWDKGVGEYVEAARRLRGKARFLLAGEPDYGNPASVTEEDLERWREEGVVELLGHRSDIPELLRQSDVAVLPSRYFEGVPLFLLEAAATGLPLVATDIEGCRMVVRDGENGYLVPQGDAATLAEALARLLADADLRRRMGAESRRIAETRFDQRAILLQYVSLYRQLGLPVGTARG